MLLFLLAAASLSPETLLRNTLTSSDPMFGPDAAAPIAAPGLWAAFLPGCAGLERAGADLADWPDCAKPVRIERDKVGLVSPSPDGAGPPVRRLSTRYAVAPAWPGAPAVVQIEVPGLLDSTYAYAALEVSAADPTGRFTAARLWPVRCPGAGVAGVGPERSACQATTPTGVHEAARLGAAGPVLELQRIAP